jgi:hypothetical protein
LHSWQSTQYPECAGAYSVESDLSKLRSCCFAVVTFVVSASGAAAQLPLPPVIPPAPILNPSSPLVLPPLHQVPVSPTPGGGGGGGQLSGLRPYPAPCSVFSRHPCNPSGCSVFHHGPCIPYYLPPIGQDLRLTIVSTDEDAPAVDNARDGDDHALASIRDMFAAFRACWVPPPKAEGHHGMEYTVRFALKRDGSLIAPPRMTYASHDVPTAMRDVYRDAIDAALKRCTPLHFAGGMGGAVAGRPIAIRFVDDRTIDGQDRPQ